MLVNKSGQHWTRLPWWEVGGGGHCHRGSQGVTLEVPQSMGTVGWIEVGLGDP